MKAGPGAVAEARRIGLTRVGYGRPTAEEIGRTTQGVLKGVLNRYRDLAAKAGERSQLNEIARLLALLDKEISGAERKAEVSYERRKWMMFGYWKAIAIHLRRVKRHLEREGENVKG